MFIQLVFLQIHCMDQACTCSTCHGTCCHSCTAWYGLFHSFLGDDLACSTNPSRQASDPLHIKISRTMSVPARSLTEGGVYLWFWQVKLACRGTILRASLTYASSPRCMQKEGIKFRL